MNNLRKGLILGLGLAEVNKKHVEDFTNELYKKGHVSEEEAQNLASTILEKAKDSNKRMESKIETYIREILKREELATIEHINYLEKRIELLEEEFDHLLLEREIDNMSDEELEDLLKELGIETEEDLDEYSYLEDDGDDNVVIPKKDPKKALNVKEEDRVKPKNDEDLTFDDDFVDNLLELDEAELEALLRGDLNDAKKVNLKSKSKPKRSAKAKPAKKKAVRKAKPKASKKAKKAKAPKHSGKSAN